MGRRTRLESLTILSGFHDSFGRLCFCFSVLSSSCFPPIPSPNIYTHVRTHVHSPPLSSQPGPLLWCGSIHSSLSCTPPLTVALSSVVPLVENDDFIMKASLWSLHLGLYKCSFQQIFIGHPLFTKYSRDTKVSFSPPKVYSPMSD